MVRVSEKGRKKELQGGHSEMTGKGRGEDVQGSEWGRRVKRKRRRERRRAGQGRGLRGGVIRVCQQGSRSVYQE